MHNVLATNKIMSLSGVIERVLILGRDDRNIYMFHYQSQPDFDLVYGASCGTIVN
jgi:hypothetical protein